MANISRKTVADMWIVSIRYPGQGSCQPYFEKLKAQVADVICGTPFCLYSRTPDQKQGWLIECCVPVAQPVQGEGLVCRILCGEDVLSMTHHGAYETLGKTWEALFDYIEGNNIPVRWPHREIYLDDQAFESPHHIVELQVPLANHHTPEEPSEFP